LLISGFKIIKYKLKRYDTFIVNFGASSNFQPDYLKMPVITLTTDWGTTDYFVGAMKGDILTTYPEATIIDISHNITAFNMVPGAFIFKNAWPHFPKGTVHVCAVSGSTDKPSPLIAAVYNGHYFIGVDNGFFSLVMGSIPDDCYYILDAKGNKVSPDSAVLASSAVYLAKGGKMAEMGEKMTGWVEKSMLQAVTEESTIKGSVIYIDSHGNLITNIEKALFERIRRGREFEIILKTREYIISEISSDYYGASNGNLLAFYNESGFLEISINQGKAASLLGISYSDIIRVEFR
jgi:S-adenosylmethionine hydrolase